MQHKFETVRVGIIGVGHMGSYHASACNNIANVELAAIADTKKTNLSKFKSSKIDKSTQYTDWIESVDAVIIAVPTALHYPIAKDCIERGKHVLLEKPLTKTYQEALELFKLAEKHSVILQVGHVERFNGAVQELKQIITEPYLIETHRIGPFSTRPQNDSVVLDLMIHDLDIILNLVESPVAHVHALGSKIRTNHTDIATVQIKFENGVLAHIVSSRTSQIKKRSMSIHQKNNYIHLDFTTQDISIHSHTHDSFKIGSKQLKYKQEGNVQRLFVYKDNPLKLEVEHFIKTIKTGRQLLQPTQDTVALQLALEIEALLNGESKTPERVTQNSHEHSTRRRNRDAADSSHSSVAGA